MSKKALVVSCVLVLLVGLVSFEAYAFEELKEELEEEEEVEHTLSLQAVSEIQLVDIGLPWAGAELEIPTSIEIPGRRINPDYINIEGLYKLGDYNDKTAFQGRASFKYDFKGDLYTQVGVGYLNIGGIGGLTALGKTGVEFSGSLLKLDAALVGQRTLIGGLLDEYDKPYWFGVNIGIGF
jgi:hypothetical protein